MPLDEQGIVVRIRRSAETIASLAEQAGAIRAACDALRDTLLEGGAVLTCGNGGSAAEALHLSEELIGKYRAVRPAQRALCLNADPTALTCIANDFGFEAVYARQLEGLARAGDALVAFSTSGESPNILRALERARDMDVTTIGLLGRRGGPCLALCDFPIVVAEEDTGHIQEAHQTLLHLFLEAVERPR